MRPGRNSAERGILKKKLWLAALAALAVSAMCLFAFAACNNDQNHTYSEEWSYDDTEHWHACTDEGCGATTDRAAHDWKTETLTSATCTAKGAVRYTCSTCGATKEEETDALGHDLHQHDAKAATCTEGGWKAYETCSRCDYSTYEETEKLGHLLQGSVCSRCGEEAADLLNGTYGYDFLGTLPDGEGMQALYEDIDAAVTAFHSAGQDAPENFILASFDYAECGLTDEESIAVWKTYTDDNPLYYWLSGTAQINGTQLVLLIEDDYAKAEIRANYNGLIDDALNSFAAKIDPNATAYDIALACHDIILRTADYADGSDAGEPWAHNILGVLENRTAACEGYAQTYQLMLNFAGVENLLVSGESDREARTWNLIKLDDGAWYWCDLPYDDDPDWKWGISYDYFCKTDADFLSDHTFITSGEEGISFQYNLPDRATSAYADEGFSSAKNLSLTHVPMKSSDTMPRRSAAQISRARS